MREFGGTPFQAKKIQYLASHNLGKVTTAQLDVFMMQSYHQGHILRLSRNGIFSELPHFIREGSYPTVGKMNTICIIMYDENFNKPQFMTANVYYILLCRRSGVMTTLLLQEMG